MRIVKIGLIGCGAVTLKAHIPALMNDPTAKLSSHLFQITAICGLDEQTLEHLQSLLPHVEVYRDYTDLLQNANCSAVLIATGEEYHPIISMEAVQAGKFVLCEKPLSTNTAALENTFGRLSIEQTNRIQPAFNKRFHPGYLKYLDLLEKQEFGTPVCGNFTFFTQQGRKTGWDGLLSNMIHYCDLISSIFGDIVEVKSQNIQNSTGISISATLKAADGGIASFCFSSAASWNACIHEEWQLLDANRNRYCTRNCNEIYLFRHGSEIMYNLGSNSVFWLPDSNGYKTQLKSFYLLACGEISEPVVTIDDALRAHRLFDLIRSQNEG